MSTPHVRSVAALMLQKNPALSQSQIETIFKSTAAPISPGMASVFDIVDQDEDEIFREFITVTWEQEQAPGPYEATGAGLVQADAALAATP